MADVEAPEAAGAPTAGLGDAMQRILGKTVAAANPVLARAPKPAVLPDEEVTLVKQRVREQKIQLPEQEHAIRGV